MVNNKLITNTWNIGATSGSILNSPNIATPKISLGRIAIITFKLFLTAAVGVDQFRKGRWIFIIKSIMLKHTVPVIHSNSANNTSVKVTGKNHSEMKPNITDAPPLITRVDRSEERRVG